MIVAGDSDYIALAQRSKRLGRYVVGIGVTGSTSSSLAAACDEFEYYDALTRSGDDPEPEAEPGGREPTLEVMRVPTAVKTKSVSTAKSDGQVSPMSHSQASKLLVRALELVQSKTDQDWLHSTEVKNQMLRLNPAFSEKSLKYPSFTNFVKARHNIVEVDDSAGVRKVRLRPDYLAKP